MFDMTSCGRCARAFAYVLLLSAQTVIAADQDLTGTYSIEASSKDTPNCKGAGEIRLIQEGVALNGDGVISGNCIGGPYHGTVTGFYDGDKFRIVFKSEFSYSFSSTKELVTQERIEGAYWGFGGSDSGPATLTRIE